MRHQAMVLGAIVFAVVGVAVGVRATLPIRGSVPPTPGSTPATLTPPLFSLPVSPDFETEVTPASVSVVAASIRERASAGIRSNPAVSGLGADATSKLLVAIEEQVLIYLGGSFDRQREFWERTNAKCAMLEEPRARGDGAALEQAMLELRAGWEAMAGTIALHPVSLDEVTVRQRYVGGRAIPHVDDRYVASVSTAAERWPRLSGEPSVNGYTITELLIPFFYVDATSGSAIYRAPVYFGIWFVWDQGVMDWRVHQLRVYNPTFAEIGVVPSM